jgi:hypothetical protein
VKLQSIFVAAVLTAGPAAAGGMYYEPAMTGALYDPTPMFAAHIQLGLGLASDGDTTARQVQGVGRVAGPVFHGLKGEGEMYGGFMSSDSASLTTYGMYTHLYKDAPTHAVGVFAGFAAAEEGHAYVLGAEGNLYLGQTTLSGTVAALVPESGSGGWVFDGGLDYYFTPDHKAWGNLAYYVSQGSGSDSIFKVAAGFEHRYTGTPWSAFASGSYLTSDDTHIWSGMVGVRAFLEHQPGMTLQQHDRAVPFDASSLGNISR